MENETLRDKRMRQATAHYAKRSPLFNWMSENHDRILANLDGKTILDWEPIRALATEEGVRHTDGQELTSRQMSQVWYLVRKACAKRTLSLQKPPPRHPPITANPPSESPNRVTRTPPEKTVAAVASTERKLAELPKSEGNNQIAADMTPEGSMARALRRMEERANRRVGIFRENDND